MTMLPSTAINPKNLTCAFPPNPAQRYADANYALQRKMNKEGRFQGGSCCFGAGNRYGSPPWITMPPEGRMFQEVGSVLVSSLTPGVDTTVLSFQALHGYDGVITGLFNLYTGLGFVEGSGDLTWRIRIRPRWVKYYSVITNTLGSLESPAPFYRGGVRFKAQQYVDYMVNLSLTAALDPTAKIICGLYGWYYPQS